MNKKIKLGCLLSIGLLTFGSVAVASSQGLISPIASFGEDTQEHYISLNPTNVPEIFDGNAYVALDDYSSLAYRGVSAPTEGNHIHLNAGGSIYKYEQSNGISSINAKFTGDLRVEIGPDENTVSHTYVLTSETAITPKGNYFKFLTTEGAEIESINIYYDCATADETVHELGEWTTVNEVTYLRDGSEKRTCSCGFEETRAVTKLNLADMETISGDGSYSAAALQKDKDTKGQTKVADGIYYFGSPDKALKFTGDNVITGGKSNQDSRVFVFKVAGPASIDVTAAEGSDGTKVTFGFFDGVPNETADNFAGTTYTSTSASTKAYAFKLDAAGTYYFGGTKSLKVKSIKVEIHSADTSKWLSDATNHWHASNGEGCETIFDEAEHTFAPGLNKDGQLVDKCTVCGYEDASKTYTRSADVEKGICTQDTMASSGGKDTNNSTTDKLRIYASSSNNYRAYLGFDMSALVGGSSYASVDADSYFELCFNVVGWSSGNSIQNITTERMPDHFTIKGFAIDDETDSTNTNLETITWNKANNDSAYAQFKYSVGTEIASSYVYEGIKVSGAIKAASVKLYMKVADVEQFINAKNYLVISMVSTSNDVRLVAKENTNATYGNVTESINLVY